MNPTPPRRFRFGLRTLFVLVTAICVWLGIHVNAMTRQKRAVEHLRGMGYSVFYDYEMDPHQHGQTYPHAAPGEPEWVTRLLGVDFLHHPVALNLGGADDDALEALDALPEVESIWFPDARITRDGLRRLRGLKNLQTLGFYGCRNIDDEALAELARHRQLRYLDLRGTSISDAGLAHLDGRIELSIQLR